jgi:predicted nucleotidyltransferase component of viral defense system
MITYFQIQKISSEKTIPEDIIEKDYFIELLLTYLSSNVSFVNKVVFRGGTSLKKMYFPDYRFSEDLDFIIEQKEELIEIEKILDEVLVNIAGDFPFKPLKNSDIKNDRLQVFISYNVAPEIMITKQLKIDIIKDAFIPSFSKRNIIFTYQDFINLKNKLNTYKLESVASDKISRIMDIDKEVRDVYDLWYLLKLNNLEMTRVKNELKKRFGFNFYFQNLIEEINSPLFMKTWKTRLVNQVLGLPPYNLVVADLKELIKMNFY